MKASDLHAPDDFDSVEGKIRVVRESLDGLFAGTESFRLRQDLVQWMAAASASLIVLHQVVEAILQDEIG